jgi:hypothetical protein
VREISQERRERENKRRGGREEEWQNLISI